MLSRLGNLFSIVRSRPSCRPPPTHSLVVWMVFCFFVTANAKKNVSGTACHNNTAPRRCDETKCTNFFSGGFSGAFICWALIEEEPQGSLRCADDYIGHLIDLTDDEKHDKPKGGDYVYYTCCPPEYIDEDLNEQQQVNSDNNDNNDSYQNFPSSSLQRECDSSQCTNRRDAHDCMVFPYAEAPTCNQESAYNISRLVTTGVTDRAWVQGELTQYTCCRPVLDKNGTLRPEDNEPWTNVREGCSTMTCTTPGLDCVGVQRGMWMELMTCDQDSVYRFPRIEDQLKSRIGGLVTYSCCETPDEATEQYIEGKEERLFKMSTIGPLVVSSLVLLVLVYFIGAVLSSPVLSKQAFTLYVIAVQIPDAVLQISTIYYSSHRLVVPTKIGDRRLTIIYAICSCANIWINVIIIREIFILLLRSSKRIRTNPPTVRKVVQQIGGLYFFTITIWTLFAILSRGVVQLATWYLEAVLGFTSIFAVLLPLGYLSYVCFRIWREKLLPRTGHTRGITLYFARIVIVFYAMYIPAGILVWIRPSIAVLINSLQGIFSVAAARTNDEIHGVTAALDVPFQVCRRASSAIFASSEFFRSARFRSAQGRAIRADKEDNSDSNSSSDRGHVEDDPWRRTESGGGRGNRWSSSQGRGGRQRTTTTESRTGGIVSLRMGSISDRYFSNCTSLDWTESEDRGNEETTSNVAGEEAGITTTNDEEKANSSGDAAGTPRNTTTGCFDNIGIISNVNFPFTTCKSSEVIDA